VAFLARCEDTSVSSLNSGAGILGRKGSSVSLAVEMSCVVDFCDFRVVMLRSFLLLAVKNLAGPADGRQTA
jgi:hypothetical protein